MQCQQARHVAASPLRQRASPLELRSGAPNLTIPRMVKIWSG